MAGDAGLDGSRAGEILDVGVGVGGFILCVCVCVCNRGEEGRGRERERMHEFLTQREGVHELSTHRSFSAFSCISANPVANTVE